MLLDYALMAWNDAGLLCAYTSAEIYDSGKESCLFKAEQFTNEPKTHYMDESATKKAGRLSEILRAIVDTMQCIRIAFDIIRLLRTGIV